MLLLLRSGRLYEGRGRSGKLISSKIYELSSIFRNVKGVASMHQIDLAAGLLWYIVFLLSITCHEAAHALAAYLGGDSTAYDHGQVSLDPIPHIKREPLGTVFFPILTYITSNSMFGWASAPYDPHWADRYPKRAAVMALAGPAANFVLATIAAILIHIGLHLGVFADSLHFSFTRIVLPAGPGVWEGAAKLLSIMFSLNILLGFFNLIPFPPLDGSSIINLFLPDKIAEKYQEFCRMPMFSLLGLLVAWKIFDLIFPPLFSLSLRIANF